MLFTDATLTIMPSNYNCSVCLFRTSIANEVSIPTPCKDPSTFTLPIISVKKLRRCALFVAKSQRVCVAFKVYHVQTFSYSKVC